MTIASCTRPAVWRLWCAGLLLAVLSAISASAPTATTAATATAATPATLASAAAAFAISSSAFPASEEPPWSGGDLLQRLHKHEQ